MQEAPISQDHTEANTWPYTERSVETMDQDVNTLLQAPEFPLDDHEKAIIKNYASNLMIGRYGETKCKSERSLEEMQKDSVASHRSEHALGYFLSDQAEADRTLLGLNNAQTKEEIADGLVSSFLYQIVDTKQQKQIASRSRNWQIAALKQALRADGADNTANIDDNLFGFTSNPDALLDKIDDIQAYRSFFRNVYADLKIQPDSRLNQALKDVLAIYAGKVNNSAAVLYPQLIDLSIQLSYTPESEERNALIIRLQGLMPILKYMENEARENKSLQERLTRRLDMIRNGAGTVAGKIAMISETTLALADTIRTPDGVELQTQFSPEELRLMDEMVWDSEELKTFNELILAEWGLISEHKSTWDEVRLRKGPASDGKWQVVVTPISTSLEVDVIKKVMLVPKAYNRTVTQIDPVGGLPASAHELAHVQQGEVNEVLADQIPLAKLGGRRRLVAREYGGIAEEREIIQNAFGRVRPTGTGYLRGYQTKLAGRTILEVAKAFYEAKKDADIMPAEIEKLQGLAADRVMRLYRHAGYNSQPLDYLESEVLANALGGLSVDEKRKISLLSSVFSLHDSAILHSYGLLNIEGYNILPSPSQAVIDLFRRRYLNADKNL